MALPHLRFSRHYEATVEGGVQVHAQVRPAALQKEWGRLGALSSREDLVLGARDQVPACPSSLPGPIPRVSVLRLFLCTSAHIDPDPIPGVNGTVNAQELGAGRALPEQLPPPPPALCLIRSESKGDGRKPAFRGISSSINLRMARGPVSGKRGVLESSTTLTHSSVLGVKVVQSRRVRGFYKGPTPPPAPHPRGCTHLPTQMRSRSTPPPAPHLHFSAQGWGSHLKAQSQRCSPPPCPPPASMPGESSQGQSWPNWGLAGQGKHGTKVPERGICTL